MAIPRSRRGAPLGVFVVGLFGGAGLPWYAVATGAAVGAGLLVAAFVERRRKVAFLRLYELREGPLTRGAWTLRARPGRCAPYGGGGGGISSAARAAFFRRPDFLGALASPEADASGAEGGGGGASAEGPGTTGGWGGGEYARGGGEGGAGVTGAGATGAGVAGVSWWG